MLLTFGFLVVTTMGAMRLPPLVSAALWIVVPLALTPVWLSNAAAYEWTWFPWVKTWSVALACAWISLCCASSRIPARWAGLTLWAFLVLNILEAAARDALQGHWLNAAAGILVVAASLPGDHHGNHTDRAGFHVLDYDLPWLWIASYAVWHNCFIYINWGGSIIAQNIAAISASLALAWWLDRRAWLHARAVTLGLYILVYDTFFGPFKREFNSMSWQDPSMVIPFQIASLGFAAVACIVALRPHRTDPTRAADDRLLREREEPR
jgi:Family of unknown function (DUF5692)